MEAEMYVVPYKTGWKVGYFEAEELKEIVFFNKEEAKAFFNAKVKEKYPSFNSTKKDPA